MGHSSLFRESYVEPIDVPAIDFRALGSPEKGEREAAIEQLDLAFQKYGFVYISHHPIPQATVDAAFAQARRFFALAQPAKELIAHPPSGGIDDNRGWAKTGLGHTVQLGFDAKDAQGIRENNPDFKETLELGNPFHQGLPPNKWLPEDHLPGFKSFVEQWWSDCASLNHSLLRCLGEALYSGDEKYLSHLHSEDDCHMTWNFYASMALKPLQTSDHKRLNAHTDFGTLTLVFQDQVGGLEIHDGVVYRPIVPIPGTVIVNVGDMLEQLSNGRWKSALHRVVAPGQLMKSPGSGMEDHDGAVVDRYSLVYFGTPNPKVTIKPLPGCERRGKWEPNMHGDWGVLSAREWIQKRLAVEFQAAPLMTNEEGRYFHGMEN